MSRKKTFRQQTDSNPGTKEKERLRETDGPAAGGENNPAAETEQATDTYTPSSEEDKLAALAEEKAKLEDQLLRVAAEFDNFKKRRNLELERIIETASENLILDLLPILDDFDLLISNAQSSTETTPLLDGARMIRNKLFKVLQVRGLQPIEAEGKDFDPELHEALMEQPSEEAEPGTVITEQQKGYTLRGKLLRPSRVIVAKRPENN